MNKTLKSTGCKNGHHKDFFRRQYIEPIDPIIQMISAVYGIKKSKENRSLAKNLLIMFYVRYKKIRPHDTITVNPVRGYFGHCYNLFEMQKALMRKDYITACENLEELIALEDIKEKRVKAGIIWIMENYLIPK